MARLAFTFLLYIGTFLNTGFGNYCLITKYKHLFAVTTANNPTVSIGLSNDSLNIIKASSNNAASENSTEFIQATEIEEEECLSSGRKCVSISDYFIALFSQIAPDHLSKQLQGCLPNSKNIALHSPNKYLVYRVIKI